MRERFNRMVKRSDAMSQDATSNGEHRGSPGKRQELHQPWREPDNSSTTGTRQTLMKPVAGSQAEIETDVIQFDDAGDQTIDPDCHQHGDQGKHGQLPAERGFADCSERNDDNLGRQDEIGADGARILAFSSATRSTSGCANASLRSLCSACLGSAM